MNTTRSQLPAGDAQEYPGLSSFLPGAPVNPGSAPSSASSANPLAGLNMQSIRQFIDRMGGIDGIVDYMGKAQKLMQGVQQMAPMLKLFAGGFGLKKSSAPSSHDLYEPLPRYRRRRRRKGSGRRRRGRRL